MQRECIARLHDGNAADKAIGCGHIARHKGFPSYRAARRVIPLRGRNIGLVDAHGLACRWIGHENRFPFGLKIKGFGAKAARVCGILQRSSGPPYLMR